jgi:hypothetical protein
MQKLLEYDYEKSPVKYEAVVTILSNIVTCAKAHPCKFILSTKQIFGLWDVIFNMEKYPISLVRNISKILSFFFLVGKNMD